MRGLPVGQLWDPATWSSSVPRAPIPVVLMVPGHHSGYLSTFCAPTIQIAPEIYSSSAMHFPRAREGRFPAVEAMGEGNQSGFVRFLHSASSRTVAAIVHKFFQEARDVEGQNRLWAARKEESVRFEISRESARSAEGTALERARKEGIARWRSARIDLLDELPEIVVISCMAEIGLTL
ncbi:hypothetical protein AG1IA_08499 [Rhizoctonia solani AG-1 IA]|uniref:Uncharacterized protein n=1 Tax=Thanatephorus cucumeris (strain AG1-IA) TaxID=983506 RepID=L8WGZ9_THACA|nr:hypothetical protein AG1IA_08499 [Rhizoctonia solani AG-1 IA]